MNNEKIRYLLSFIMRKIVKNARNARSLKRIRRVDFFGYQLFALEDANSNFSTYMEKVEIRNGKIIRQTVQ